MNSMLKGNRTYLVTAAGFITGLGMALNALATGDMSTIGEAVLLMFTSAAQFFQRASTIDN